MFAVVYSFKVKEFHEKDFIEEWRSLTNAIRKYEGSYGSRLHKESDGHFLAYALWPDKETWENSGSKLPEQALVHSSQMKACCEKIETLHKLDVIEDLLHDDLFK